MTAETTWGGRVPPHSYPAEQQLLGALFHRNAIWDDISEYLRPEHFASPEHGRIYQACGRLIERGSVAIPSTIIPYFEQDGQLAEIGGPEYIRQLFECVVSVLAARDHARLIHDLHLRRELIGLGEDLVDAAFSPDPDVSADEIRAQHEAALTALDAGTTDGPRTAEAVGTCFIIDLEAACKGGGGGLLTGLADFDRRLGGLHPSDLLILAGRPSMGKSAVAISLLRRLARRGVPVGLFSLEMSAEQVFARLAAEEVGIPFTRFRDGSLSVAEQMATTEATMALQALPLFIDDSAALTVAALAARARRLRRRHKVEVVAIDYLQLLRGGTRRAENRVQEVSEITRNLKVLAKQLQVPVIALSQLSRAVESREDKRPQLSDLRESGSIEQDADAVMFAYREQYYLERAEPVPRADEDVSKFNDRHSKWLARMSEVAGTVDLLIAKQRHGPVGSVRLAYNAATNTLSDLAREGDYGPDSND
jgi:replicative DNA helicase